MWSTLPVVLVTLVLALAASIVRRRRRRDPLRMSDQWAVNEKRTTLDLRRVND